MQDVLSLGKLNVSASLIINFVINIRRELLLVEVFDNLRQVGSFVVGKLCRAHIKWRLLGVRLQASAAAMPSTLRILALLMIGILGAGTTNSGIFIDEMGTLRAMLESAVIDR